MLALLIILIVIIAIASLTNSGTAHAPTIVPTPAAPSQTVVPAATPPPHATPVPTRKKGALGIGDGLMMQRSTALLQRAGALASTGPTTVFTGPGNAYTGRQLVVRMASGRQVVVGRADPYVQPVWSPTGRFLLYVRVQPTSTTPGALWSLVRYDTRTHTSSVLARVPGMALTPLGWSSGRVLFTVARSTDTSIYAAGSPPRFISILLSQPLTAARLSPDGRYIAVASAASCAWCTLDMFDLQTLTTWYGPTGTPDEADIAWMGNHTLITTQGGQILAIDAANDTARHYALPASLSLHWRDPLRVVPVGRDLRLTDSVTGVVYTAAATG